jgi:hypothetical protein
MVLLLAVGGCAAEVPSPGVVADARGTAIALDSIEGPPAPVFHRLVQNLNQEAQARQIAVVQRAEQAPYRLRGYLSPHSDGHKTSIVWVWDIYDTAEHRAFRLNGEETATTARKSWAAADDAMLRRIAQVSVEQLAMFLAASRAPAAPAAVPAGTLASRTTALLGQIDDFRPEASGIFRIFERETVQAQADLSNVGDPEHPAGIPRPPQRPSPIRTPNSRPPSGCPQESWREESWRAIRP